MLHSVPCGGYSTQKASLCEQPGTLECGITCHQMTACINGSCVHCPSCLQAIKVSGGSTLYIAGQIGLIPGTTDFAAEDITGQTTQVGRDLLGMRHLHTFRGL